VSETTAAQLNEMLRGVVTDGTGELAQVSGTRSREIGTLRKPPYELTPYMRLRRLRTGRVARPSPS
jgi:hypothetical protein